MGVWSFFGWFFFFLWRGFLFCCFSFFDVFLFFFFLESIHLVIYSCTGSLLLRTGFLLPWQAGLVSNCVYGLLLCHSSLLQSLGAWASAVVANRL